MITPGAFSGVAASGGFYRDDGTWFPTAALDPLPPAILCQWSHAWCHGDPGQRPVAIAVPERVGPAVRVRGVLASTARGPWNALTHGLHDRLSVVSVGDPDLDFTSAPSGGIQAAGWVLTACDFVRYPRDPGAGVTELRAELTDAERDTQARLDALIADPDGLLAIDLDAAARQATRDRVAALEPLRAIVEPMLTVEALR